METKILNGAPYRDAVFSEIKNEITAIKEKKGKTPGIAFVAFTGHLPLMKYTIGLHDQAARLLGFDVTIETVPHNAGEEDMLKLIDRLNSTDTVHAVVLLQPVPKHVNALRIIERIDRNKEVEGFHPLNVIDTLIKGIYNTRYPMCLPAALFELFRHAGIKVKKGQEFVFAADCDFISNPFRSLILRTASSQVIPEDCPYTVVNSDNDKIKDICKRADYLFVISENPEFLQPEWLKPGVCIVDIYSNLVKEVPGKKNPDVMVPVIRGGVNTDSVINIAGAIAPCPGGLMPVLLAILLRNALIAFKNSIPVDAVAY